MTLFRDEGLPRRLDPAQAASFVATSETSTRATLARLITSTMSRDGGDYVTGLLPAKSRQFMYSPKAKMVFDEAEFGFTTGSTRLTNYPDLRRVLQLALA